MYANEVIKKCNVTRDTLRHYLSVGILEEHRNPENNYRIYSKQDIEIVNFVKNAKKIGMSLQEIKTVVNDLRKSKCKHKAFTPYLYKQIEIIEQKEKELDQVKASIKETLTAIQNKDCEVKEEPFSF